MVAFAASKVGAFGLPPPPSTTITTPPQLLLHTYSYSHQVTSPYAHVGTRQCTVGGSRPSRCHAPSGATCCLATRGRSRAPRWLDAQLVRVEVLRLEVAKQPRPPLPVSARWFAPLGHFALRKGTSRSYRSSSLR